MVAVGFSDRVNPVDHPVLACVGMTFPIVLLLNIAFLLLWLIFKWRMIWIPILGFILAYIPITIYAPLNIPQAQPDDALKVISYNVCIYGGNFRYEQGFETVLDYLSKEKADIVCLQEDVDTWRKYVFNHYEKYYAYNDTIHFSEGMTTNGVGIHTRFPIISRQRIDYPSRANGSAAWLLKMDNGDTLMVINNHFESTHLSTEDRRMYSGMINGEVRGDTARKESRKLLATLAESAVIRAHGIDAVYQFISQYANRYPILLCGDFNDTPISYSRHRIAQQLTDCFVATGRGLGLSYNQHGFNFRIDNIFCSEEITPYNCKIDTKTDASDHYPVVCWFKIDRKH